MPGRASAALVVFRGAHAYVSPNWYPSKHELHRQVPTWNYRVVHVHGRVRIRDDERFVRGVVARLTRRHEARTGAAKPWTMSDSAEDYIDQMLAAIVGIEIEITRMVGKWRLGQNREERDRRGAACKEIGRLHPLATPDDAACARAAIDDAMIQVKRLSATAK